MRRSLCFLQDLVEDYLRCQCLKDFAAFLVSLENPPLEFDSETGEFSAMIKSTQVSPAKESSNLTVVQLDTSDQHEHEVCDNKLMNFNPLSSGIIIQILLTGI